MFVNHVLVSSSLLFLQEKKELDFRMSMLDYAYVDLKKNGDYLGNCYIAWSLAYARLSGKSYYILFLL